MKQLVLATFLFLLSFLYYHNDICCMFSSYRVYGFPGQFLMIQKTTDSFDEAKKVESLSTLELLDQGWQPTFSASLSSPISLSPLFNIVVNFSSIYLLVLILSKLRLFK